MSIAASLTILSSHLITILAETSDPSTNPPKAPDDNLVTPGVWGFIAIFAVGVATVALVVDMTRRVRRTRYRGEIREQIELERQEAAREAAGLDDEFRDGFDAEGRPLDR
ncbi:hypothetical protein [Frondihabitans cladoniiphilus]|uniref:Uncharacterized protein n=1 Tax=Frondihabitans cladoniiphilus TaxID=715785 RepID=A0ABP8VTM2_9MICO